MSDSKKTAFRMILVVSGFIAFYGIILFRSYQLQVLGNAKINRLVENQYKSKIVEKPKRGGIFDRNHDPLAVDIEVASIGVHPHLVKDKSALAKDLRSTTGLSATDIQKKLNSKRKFLWVKRRIPLRDALELKSKKHKGIQVVKEYKRFYPHKHLAGQLMGAVGYDAEALGGLELAYDNLLKSESFKTHVERDARGRHITLRSKSESTHNVHLTIDTKIQHFTETALISAAKKHDVKNGFAVVMDIKSGEILAMANYPSFNPNLYWTYKPEFWKNHAVYNAYEPGSTFKTMLMASALEEGVVEPKDKYFCENGAMKVGEHTVKDTHPYGTITAEEVFQFSSNIGVTKIAKKLGKDNFYDFILSLGFGEKTEIGFKGESAGYIRDAKTWKDIEFSNISFGQGLSVTGLQMISAFSGLVNDGRVMQPILIKKITDQDGEIVFENEPTERIKLISDDTSEKLRHMLELVTKPEGTGNAAAISFYGSAGKTGTAQKIDPKTRQYSDKDYISSFVGYAPVNDPQIAIYVVYDSPQKHSYYGGLVAGPAFRRIAEKSLAYMAKAPDEQFASKSNDQNSSNETSHWDKMLAAMNEGKMPNLEGTSLRDLRKMALEKGIQLNITGHGFVTEQKPGAGESLAKNWQLKLGS
jgi:cell division protein FtsI (penicillin-binding protein 3)